MGKRVLISMGMALVCLVVVSSGLAEDKGARLKGEVAALLQRHDTAFSAQDLKGVMKTFVVGPEIFLMGTGPGEIYRAKEGVEGAYSQFFTQFEKGSVTFGYDWISAGSRGDLAWFAAEGTIKGSLKGQTREIGFNLSGTLLKQKGAWRFLAMHFSRLGVAAEPAAETKK